MILKKISLLYCGIFAKLVNKPRRKGVSVCGVVR